MRYELVVHLTAERGKNLGGKKLYSGTDWYAAKEQLNIWANEYRDSMDDIVLRVRR